MISRVEGKEVQVAEAKQTCVGRDSVYCQATVFLTELRHQHDGSSRNGDRALPVPQVLFALVGGDVCDMLGQFCSDFAHPQAATESVHVVRRLDSIHGAVFDIQLVDNRLEASHDDHHVGIPTKQKGRNGLSANKAGRSDGETPSSIPRCGCYFLECSRALFDSASHVDASRARFVHLPLP